MKIKQIVGEHKKGFKAKKYAQKPKTYIEPTKPQKPQAPVSEEAKITKSDATGVEITAADGVKTTLPPEKAAALTPDPSNPNEYDLNPAATSPTGDTPPGPKVGANVEIKTAEGAGESGLGTIPTTEFVKGIYSLAAEYGPDAPNPDAVKKMMVLAPNGEVDLEQTFNKVIAAFQSSLPELEKMLNELEKLVQSAEAQPQVSPQQPAGNFDPNVDDGGTAYRPGEKEWAEKAAAQGNIDNLAKFNAAADAALGKRTATAESKFQEELEAMLRIAKLR